MGESLGIILGGGESLGIILGGGGGGESLPIFWWGCAA